MIIQEKQQSITHRTELTIKSENNQLPNGELNVGIGPLHYWNVTKFIKK